jgi:hypothetical protein
MWATILRYACESPACPVSSVVAMALTPGDEEVRHSLKPRCPGCAQWLVLVHVRHEEVTAPLAEAHVPVVGPTRGAVQSC